LLAWALRQLGGEAQSVVPQLLEKIRSKDREARLHAVTALGSFGESGDPKVVECLVAALEDEDSRVRDCAAGGLGSAKTASPKITNVLVAALEKERKDSLRCSLAENVLKLDADNEKAASAIIDLVGCKNSNTAMSAALDAGRLHGKNAEAAVPVLIKALQHHNRHVSLPPRSRWETWASLPSQPSRHSRLLPKIRTNGFLAWLSNLWTTLGNRWVGGLVWKIIV
jgi:HEAT repeat protein